jgi:peptidoglycan/LPS O-acetylase OafA/YrhL
LADEYKQLGKHIAAGAGFVSNFVFWNESGYFDNSAETKPLLHLWTLGIEEQFYIIWPLLLWAAWKGKFNLLTLTLIIATISFALNIKGLRTDAIATFYSPQTRFWELLIGSILAYVTLYKPNIGATKRQALNTYLNAIIYTKSAQTNENTLRNVQSILGATLIGAGLLIITKERHFPGTWALLPTLGAVLIISAGSQAWLNRVLLSNRVLVWFGLISFPLYLWHWPLLSFARIVEREVLSREIRISAVILSVVLAWLTYKLVERPIRLEKKVKLKVATLVFLMGLTGSFGCIAYSHDGLKFRSAAQSPTQFREDLRKKAGKLRGVEIRSGICHFNKQGRYKELDFFIANWSCLSDDEGLLNTSVLVFGDSHSADKAMGLRLNGVDVIQLGGAGCSVNPELVADKNSFCPALFELIKHFDDKFDSVILSNNFPANEITEENLSQILKYWGERKQVYLFTPMPDFTAQMNDFLKNGKIISKPDFTREDEFLKVLDKIIIPSNFKVVKTSEIWCLNRASDDNYPCSFALNNKLFMIDGGHLSALGAKLFAQNMLSHPLLKSLFYK